MAKENSQKIKLLKLMELLRQETDEQHPMAATVVCQKLNDMEVACDRRTLTRDIQALNDYGYEVMTTMISHEKAYYVEDRSFSVPELKILIDAVQAASFVTDKKTAELIRKIANLGGSHSAERLTATVITTMSWSRSHLCSTKTTIIWFATAQGMTTPRTTALTVWMPWK